MEVKSKGYCYYIVWLTVIRYFPSVALILADDPAASALCSTYSSASCDVPCRMCIQDLKRLHVGKGKFRHPTNTFGLAKLAATELLESIGEGRRRKSRKTKNDDDEDNEQAEDEDEFDDDYISDDSDQVYAAVDEAAAGIIDGDDDYVADDNDDDDAYVQPKRKKSRNHKGRKLRKSSIATVLTALEKAKKQSIAPNISVYIYC